MRVTFCSIVFMGCLALRSGIANCLRFPMKNDTGKTLKSLKSVKIRLCLSTFLTEIGDLKRDLKLLFMKVLMVTEALVYQTSARA